MSYERGNEHHDQHLTVERRVTSQVQSHRYLSYQRRQERPLLVNESTYEKTRRNSISGSGQKKPKNTTPLQQKPPIMSVVKRTSKQLSDAGRDVISARGSVAGSVVGSVQNSTGSRKSIESIREERQMNALSRASQFLNQELGSVEIADKAGNCSVS